MINISGAGLLMNGCNDCHSALTTWNCPVLPKLKVSWAGCTKASVHYSYVDTISL